MVNPNNTINTPEHSDDEAHELTAEDVSLGAARRMLGEKTENQNNLAKTVRLMEKLHASEVMGTPEATKQFLDSLSYDDFMKWISLVNGVERGIPTTERGKVSSSHIQSEGMLLGTSIEYRPPNIQHRGPLLEKALEKAKSIEDPETAGLTLGFALNAIHFFEDGNGRTARMVYALLSKGYDGSEDSKKFYSSLLENTKGRETIDPNPSLGDVDAEIQNEMAARAREKFHYQDAFDGKPPRYVHDGFPNAFVGEYNPDELAVNDDIDADYRSYLYEVMENGRFTILSLMATFPPERIKDYVRTSEDGKRTFVDGNEFLPTLTKEEIKEWWVKSQQATANYVNRLINFSDREDGKAIVEAYRLAASERKNES